MDIQGQVVILLITQILTIISLFLTNYMSRRQSAQLLQDEIQTRKRIDHLERQLTEFYGPISALLSINLGILRITYDPKTQTYFQDVPDDFLRELKATVMIPNNLAIVEIIKHNFHLIEGSALPPHVVDFVVHAVTWPIYRKHGLERAKYLSRFRFPQEFGEYITATTDTLKAEYLALVTKHGSSAHAENGKM
jgi:hypothetical protein